MNRTKAFQVPFSVTHIQGLLSKPIQQPSCVLDPILFSISDKSSCTVARSPPGSKLQGSIQYIRVDHSSQRHPVSVFVQATALGRLSATVCTRVTCVGVCTQSQTRRELEPSWDRCRNLMGACFFQLEILNLQLYKVHAPICVHPITHASLCTQTHNCTHAYIRTGAELKKQELTTDAKLLD